MELRHLRYFVAVAEELNFRRAGERVYVAQGALSVQIRKLEEELGVRLLDRSPRSVSLTSAGTAFLPEARRVLHQAEIARLATQNARDHATSRLRIGYMPASLPANVLRAVQRLGAMMPVLDTTLEPGTTSQLVAGVREGSLDIAVVPLPTPTAGLRVTTLGAQRVVAAMPVSSEHATRDEVRLHQLAPERILVLPRESNRSLYDGIVAGCHEAGLFPSLVELPDADLDRAVLAVASAGGLALLPEAVVDRHCAPGVRFVVVSDDHATFTTAVVTSRDTDHMPTIAFLRLMPAQVAPRAAGAAEDVVRSADG
jgi:DNA-binding transcriptional LysR family regulator